MNATELRAKSVPDLNARLVELYRERMNLRLQRATGQLANPARFRAVRQDIARIKTVLGELGRTEK